MTAQTPDLSTTGVFSIEGKGLKLDTAESVEEYVKQLQSLTSLEEVRLSGSSYGIDATKALAAALKSKLSLRVSQMHVPLKLNMIRLILDCRL